MTSRQVDAFTELTPIQQCRQRPDMWIGSTAPEAVMMPCFDGKVIRRKLVPDYVDAVDRLLLEILSNAQDNCTYSIMVGKEPDEIHVTLTDKLITIVNGGVNIPVEKMPSGVYVPTMLWGSLFSSSHYEESRARYSRSGSAGGCNGVGGALVNIYSERFDVIVEDPVTQRRFTQSWSRGEPIPGAGPDIVEDKSITTTRISVSYLLDFPFFNLERYSPSMLEVLQFHVVTASFTAKVPVVLTNPAGLTTRYDLRLIRDYAALYPQLRPTPDIKRIEYHALSPEAVAKHLTYTEVVTNHIELPRVESLIVDRLVPITDEDSSEQQGASRGRGRKKRAAGDSALAVGAQQISFVNGIITINGGTHVDALITAFFGKILESLGITLANAKKHISFLLSVRVDGPRFKGNSKSQLLAPKVPIEAIPPQLLKELNTWDTMQRLQAINEAVIMTELKKTDGKKIRRLPEVKELDDANNAGTSQSTGCTLIVVEGGSAASYPQSLRDLTPHGRDIYGILLLQGKPVNVLKADNTQLTLASGFYAILKQAIGLQEGVDYKVSANYKKLRYGHCLIATDADCDGWHILCLLLLMFYERFPSLVDRGFISFLRTPLLRVPGTRGLTFYTKRAYEQWRERARQAGGTQAALANRKARYFKGLGAANRDNVAEDAATQRSVLAITDSDHSAKESLSLGFDKKRPRDRKAWLATPVIGEFLDTDEQTQTISHFVHTGLKLYSLDNITRAIPSVMDGCKEAMRKVLYTGFGELGMDAGNRHASMTKEERKAAGLKPVGSASAPVPPTNKTFEIVSMTTKKCCYHHGEAILGAVVSRMCIDCVGSNNIPWFNPESAFGTVEDHRIPNPRYTAVGPAWWWPYVFNEADAGLVPHVTDEDKTCEPRFLLPVACWALCNSADGVGTGYSTHIPGHNIEEVALAHLCLLDGRESFPPLIPWWRGFRGHVSLVPCSIARHMQTVEQSVAPEDVNTTLTTTDNESSPLNDDGADETDDGEDYSASPAEQTKMVCIVDGTFFVQGNTVVITSLPLRKYSDFMAILADLSEKKIVSDYRNLSAGDSVRFEVDMAVAPDGTSHKGNLMKLFRLRRITAMSNLVLLDENGLPKKFQSAAEILRYFHERRLHYYELRRMGIIESQRQKVIRLDQRMRLIQACITKEIVYNGVSRADVNAQITEKLPDVPHKIFTELKAHDFCADAVASLASEIQASQRHLADLETTSKEELWKRDLLAFLKEYRAIYGGKNVSEPYKALPW